MKVVFLEGLMQKSNARGAHDGIYNGISDEIDTLERAIHHSFMQEAEDTNFIVDWMWISRNSECLYKCRHGMISVAG